MKCEHCQVEIKEPVYTITGKFVNIETREPMKIELVYCHKICLYLYILDDLSQSPYSKIFSHHGNQ